MPTLSAPRRPPPEPDDHGYDDDRKPHKNHMAISAASIIAASRLRLANYPRTPEVQEDIPQPRASAVGAKRTFGYECLLLTQSGDW
jgi:hypothetical protein